MGDLKNQIFLQYINHAIELARKEFIAKNTPKKDKRFLVKGITYEISACKFENGKFKFEISSKIPQELFYSKSGIDQFFRDVVKVMNGCDKKPSEWQMENIVHNTTEMELKERDYVKLMYEYAESELYSPDEVEKKYRRHQAKNIPIPNYPDVTTPTGKLVIAIIEEKMGMFVRQNVTDFFKANEEAKKKIKSAPPKQAKKKSAAATKAKAAASPAKAAGPAAKSKKKTAVSKVKPKKPAAKKRKK